MFVCLLLLGFSGVFFVVVVFSWRVVAACLFRCFVFCLLLLLCVFVYFYFIFIFIFLMVCVCLCVNARARACVRTCVCTYVRVCMCVPMCLLIIVKQQPQHYKRTKQNETKQNAGCDESLTTHVPKHPLSALSESSMRVYIGNISDAGLASAVVFHNLPAVLSHPGGNPCLFRTPPVKKRRGNEHHP